MPALVFGYLIAVIVGLCAAILAGPTGVASFLLLCGVGVGIVWASSKQHERSQGAHESGAAQRGGGDNSSDHSR